MRRLQFKSNPKRKTQRPSKDWFEISKPVPHSRPAFIDRLLSDYASQRTNRIDTDCPNVYSWL